MVNDLSIGAETVEISKYAFSGSATPVSWRNRAAEILRKIADTLFEQINLLADKLDGGLENEAASLFDDFGISEKEAILAKEAQFARLLGILNDPCPECNANGAIQTVGDDVVACPTCKGTKVDPAYLLEDSFQIDSLF